MIPVTDGHAVLSPCYRKTVLVPGLLTTGTFGESPLVWAARQKSKSKSKAKAKAKSLWPEG